MSRRFTLFALLTAVCLLFASCGALFLKTPVSNKGSIVIPLRASDRKASNPLASSPLELCTRFVFSIENANYKGTAEGTTTIEFGEIPFGTYTLTGTAYGKFSDESNAPEEIVATCKVENLVIDSTEPKAISAVFTLSESTLIYFNGYTVEENQQGTPVTVVYTGTDKATKISETVTTNTESGTTTTIKEYAIDAKGNNTLETNGNLFVTKETVTEPQPSGNKITVTEYDYNNGSPLTSKITVTEPGGKKTVSEYNLNASTQGCSKRVTVEEGNTTIVEKYTSNEATTPNEKVVTTVATTDTLIEEYVLNASSSLAKAKVTELITAGSNKGQKTETEYNTSTEKPVKETVTSPDNHKTISTFDYSVNNQVTTTTYLTDWNPDTDPTGTNPNSYNVAKIIETTASSTKTTEYTRDSGATTASEPHYDKDGQLMAPFTQTKVTVENDSATTITTTNYNFGLYGETGSEILKPTTMIETEEDGAGNIIATHETTFDYNDPYGRIKEVKRDGVPTEKWIYQAYTCKVYARKETIPTTLTLDYCKNYGNSNVIFYVPSDDKNALKIDALTTSATALEDAGKQFLTDNFVLCGTSGENADLYWAKTTSDGKDVTISGDNDRLRSKTIKEGEGDNLYPVIYKADQALFETKHSDCIRLTVDTENQIVYCIIHNDKGNCSNFWSSYTTYLIKDESGTPINFGSTGNKQGAGGN